MKYKYDHRSFSLALFVVCVRLVKYVTVVASADRQGWGVATTTTTTT